MADYDVLQRALESGIVDINTLQAQVEKMLRDELLDLHCYEIYQGKDGKWYTYLPDQEKGRRFIKRTTQEAIEDVVVNYYEEQRIVAKRKSLEWVFKAWIEEKIENLEITNGTYDRYHNDFKRFFTNSDLIEKSIDLITELDIEKFIRKTIVEMKLTSKAYSNLRTLFLGMFTWAKRNGYTEINIVQLFNSFKFSSKIFTKKKRDDTAQIFNEDEVELLLNYLIEHPSMENLGLILVFNTGIRCGELAALKFTDFNYKENTLHICRQEIKYKSNIKGRCVHEVVGYTKTSSGDRTVILPDGCINIVKRLRLMNPNGVYLFEHSGERVLSGTFNDRLYSACTACHIPRRSMHKIRKTYGTTLLDADVDESLVMAQMGHSDIATTRKYYYYSNKNMDVKRSQINNALARKKSNEKMSVIA